MLLKHPLGPGPHTLWTSRVCLMLVEVRPRCVHALKASSRPRAPTRSEHLVFCLMLVEVRPRCVHALKASSRPRAPHALNISCFAWCWWRFGLVVFSALKAASRPRAPTRSEHLVFCLVLVEVRPRCVHALKASSRPRAPHALNISCFAWCWWRFGLVVFMLLKHPLGPGPHALWTSRVLPDVGGGSASLCSCS